MTDGTVLIRQDSDGDRPIDNVIVLNDVGESVYRQRIAIGGSAIQADPHNTTTTPLTAGATFTGTATDVSAYQQINIEIYGRPSAIQGDGSTAVASFFFEFSPDGTNWDISVPALVRDPGLVIPVPVINVGRYFRVVYVNDGGALAISVLGLPDTAGTPTAQTVFRLTTQLLPLATKELTRTMDQGISGSDPAQLVRAGIMGRLPGGTYGNVGIRQTGENQFALLARDVGLEENRTIFGALNTETALPDLRVNFASDRLANVLSTSTVTTGTVTQANAKGTVATGTGSGGAATMRSRLPIRYRPGSETRLDFTAVFTTGVASSKQSIGGMHSADANGFFLGYSGATFGVTVRSTGSDTFTARSSWNGDPLDGSTGSEFTSNGIPVVWDPTKGNIYRIRFGWLGYSVILFEVQSPDGRYVRMHTVPYPNTATSPSIQQPDLDLWSHVENTGNTTSVSISTSSWRGSTMTHPHQQRSIIFDRTNAKDGSLPSGSPPTINATFNSEPNVFDSGWVPTNDFPGGNFLNVFGDVSLSVYLLNASDTAGSNMVGDTAPAITTTAFIPSPLAAPYFDNYYRIIVTNTSGSSAMSYRVVNWGAEVQTPPLQVGLNSTILPFFTAALNRSVIVGRDPDGSYVNFPASGPVTANSTTSNLAGGATFTGTFTETSGYTSISVMVNASHDSATSGVTFQFSTDGSNIDRSVSYDYVAANGGAFFVLPVEAQYFRLVYTNGATLTTSLRIETTFSDDPLPAVQAPLSSRVTRSQVAAMVKNDPIPLVSARTSQETVGTTSAQLTCSSAPLSLRKSLSFKSDANNTNNNIIYISFASPATTGNGYGLSNGDSIDIEIGDRDDSGAVVGIYAIATNAGQKLHVMEIA